MKKVTTQRIELIPLAQIEPSNYQRATNYAQVKSIVANFDEAKLGTLTVSYRNGRYILIDGQHRVSALRALGYTHAMAVILTGLNYKDEARYFSTQGADKRSLRPAELYKAGLVAKDEVCLRIKEIVEANGFIIGFDSKNFYQIGALGALFTIAEEYGFGNLDDTLCLIASTWDEYPQATSGECLLGIAEFVRRYSVADFDELMRDSFDIIWSKYQDSMRGRHYSAKARENFCRIIVKYYNRNYRSGSKNRLQWEGDDADENVDR